MGRAASAHTRLRREVETDRKVKERLRLKELREHLLAAQRLRHVKIKRVRALCSAAHQRYLESSRARRSALFAELRAERQANASSCSAALERVSGSAEQKVSAARAAFGEARRHQRQQAVWDRSLAQPGTQSLGKALAAHRAREREEEVERNIPDELLPVWRAVKSRVHATDRMDRTEAFLQWVHDHSAEVYRILDADAARHLLRMQREEEACADGLCVDPLAADEHDARAEHARGEVPF